MRQEPSYFPYGSKVPFETLTGKTITNIENLEKGSSNAVFIECADGTSYWMAHDQSCCESVQIEDVAGDVADLIDSPVLIAEESSSQEQPADVPAPEYQDCFTWTFYRLTTAKGLVVIRWYGSSNGYYGESVDLYKIVPEEDQ